MKTPNLPNETIRDVVIGDDDTIRLTCDNCAIVFEAIGDCCSYSYLRYYDSMHSAIGKTLESVNRESVDLNDSHDYAEVNGYDYYSYHRYTFTYTDGTTSTCELVNVSNGYYDGWLDYQVVPLH